MNGQFIPPVGDKIFTVPEVAAFLKISRSKIYYLISRKEIPHLKIGRNVRIRQTDLQKWMDNQVKQLNFDALFKS
jgi:excisionase family DNA binding protein